MHQVGLAEPDAAIKEQRVERAEPDGRDGGLGDAPGGGMGELVRLADDEMIEGEARSRGALTSLSSGASVA